MVTTKIDKCNIHVSPIGFGAFKIGRNQKVKYRESYELPSAKETHTFLNQIVDLGVNYIDTAPAYGLSEERIGAALAHRRKEFILSTKTGETFDHEGSRYDFTREATIKSVHQSLKRLKTDYLDIVYIHSNGRDRFIQEQTDVVPTLQELRSLGLIRSIGFSGKTVEGAREAVTWADVLMVEYHLSDRSHADVMERANELGVGIIIKKGLASGNLPADEAIRFVLGNPHVHSLVIGGLNLEHIKHNLKVAAEIFSSTSAA